MSDYSLMFVMIYMGTVLATLIVGSCLRYFLGNPKLRVLYREIVIILGAVGVFFTIVGLSLVFLIMYLNL